MSKQILHIELDPPSNTKQEVILASNFKCPACNGRGYFSSYSPGEKDKGKTSCTQCDATGRLKAKVEIIWSPDFN